MSLTLVTAPATMPVSSAEAAAHLRVDAPQIEVLESLIAAATDYLDGRDGILGRALMVQTWDLTLDDFPCWGLDSYEALDPPIKIPLPPLVSVTSVKYIDTAGIEQTLANTEYTVDLGRNQVYLAYGKAWPSIRDVPNAVTVRFVAGHTAQTLPPADKLLVLWLTAHWHEHREPVVVGEIPAQVPDHLERLIGARRLWSAA